VRGLLSFPTITCRPSILSLIARSWWFCSFILLGICALHSLSLQAAELFQWFLLLCYIDMVNLGLPTVTWTFCECFICFDYINCLQWNTPSITCQFRGYPKYKH
jgi:hypothetical protein